MPGAWWRQQQQRYCEAQPPQQQPGQKALYMSYVIPEFVARLIHVSSPVFLSVPIVV